MNNLEVINVTASNNFVGDVALNLVNAGQTTQVTNQASTTNLTFSNIATNTALAVKNISAPLTTQFDYASVSGTADTANLTVENDSDGVIIVNGVETINLTSSGTIANSVNLVDNALLTLNISGSNDLNIGVPATATNVNGTSFTGDLTATLTAAGTLSGGSGADTLAVTAGSTVNGNAGNDTITGGAGADSINGGADNDRVVFAAGNFTAADTVDGSTGTNTLAAAVADINTVDAAALTTVDNIQILEATTTLLGAAAGQSINASNIDSSINTVELVLGTDAANAATITFNTGASTLNLDDALAAGAGVAALTLQDATAATGESVTIVKNYAINENAFGQALTVAGIESLNFNTGSTAVATTQATGAIGMTGEAAGSNLAITATGANEFSLGVVTTTSTGVLSIDVSGLTAQATGTTATVAAPVSSGTVSITGSAGADALTGDANSANTITGGAGSDTLTGGSAADSLSGGAAADSIYGVSGNDTLLGGDGADLISVGSAAGAFAAGTVSVDGGADDDVILVGNTLTAGDVITGGTGRDTLAVTGTIIANYAGATDLETFRLDATGLSQNLAFYTGTTFDTVAYNIAGGSDTVSGAAAAVTDVRILNGTTLANFQHTDTLHDAVTIGAYTDIDTTVTTVTAINEETITIGDGAITSSAAANDTLTITTLNAGDMTSLVFTGSANKEITNAIAGVNGTLTSVDAHANTGTVSVSAASATVGVTMYGSSTAASTVIGGTSTDSITGGSAADVLTGNAGADTIVSGGGADTITAGEANDTITLGTGIQTVVQGADDSIAASAVVVAAPGVIAAGDTMTFGAYVDVVNSFTAGTGGDVLSLVNAGAILATSLIGKDEAVLTADKNFYASGTWNVLTQTFTIAANGVGADTLILSSQGAGNIDNALATNDNALILVGVNSANLVAANFI